MTNISSVFDYFKCKHAEDLLQNILIRNDKGKIIAYLKPIIKDYMEMDPKLPELLSRWRKENPTIATGNFEITVERTSKWLDNLVIGRDDRLLFMIISIDNIPLGHIGFSNFDLKRNIGELDSVLRGVKQGHPGLMTYATKALMKWGFSALGLTEIELSVYSDNFDAIRFYRKLGFTTINKVPLIKILLPDEEKYEEAPNDYEGPIDKYYLKMRYDKNIKN